MNHVMRQHAPSLVCFAHNSRVAIGGSVLGGMVAVEFLAALIGHLA